jgi:beta-1,4-mannosyltransferase
MHSLKEVVKSPSGLDILHLHALPYFQLSAIRLARYISFYKRLKHLRARGVKIVWTLHDFQNHDTAHVGIESAASKYLYKKVDDLIVHGRSAKEMAEANWGSGCPISIIPHGNYIDSYPNSIGREAARNAFGFCASEFVYLFLGLIRPYKGVIEMIEAFKRTAAENSRLIIAGRAVGDKMGAEVEALAQGDSRIRYNPGFVEVCDVQCYMNAADVVVLPYKRILTSGAAILAMSFGKPCIAPKTGCITDTLDESGAIFFDPSSERQLEAAMEKVTLLGGKLPAMGEYNLAKAKTWDWPNVARQTASVYSTCLDRRV